MSEKLKAAVIGVGYLGTFHAQKLKAHPEVDLVGVCDFSYEQAQKVAADLQIQAYRNPQDLLKDVDYVHIAASTQSHYDLAALFLENRIPVLVEKPIAATADLAEKLCELSEKNQTLLTVGHIERLNPAFKYLKDAQDKLDYLEINRLAPFRTRGSDVSVLHDLTIHDIDLVNWITESQVVECHVAGKKMIKPTYDDVSLRLRFANGTQVTINNSRVTPQIVRNYRAVFRERVVFMNTATLEAEVLRPISSDPYHEVEKIQLNKVDALALETDRFVQCLLGKAQPLITAQEATKALKQVESFIAQLEEMKS